MGTGGQKRSTNLCILLNDPVIRSAVVAAAAERYGYQQDQVTLRFYAGRFAPPVQGSHEPVIRAWAGQQSVGARPIEVYGLSSSKPCGGQRRQRVIETMRCS